MGRKKKQLLIDVLFLTISLSFAIYILETGIAHRFILSLGELKWVGVFVAGMFFTSVFTTAPAIILLGQFAETVSLLPLAILGGLGALLGDYIIFRLVRSRLTEDFQYLVSFTKPNRFKKIFETKLFHFFMPFVGAIIIASPLPDEIGIAMLGLSKIKTRSFILISFILNSVGIFLIGFLAKSLS